MAIRGPAASEQHARRVHLDAERGEEGGLQPSPRPPGAVLQAQRAGLWAVLWKHSDHLHAGIYVPSSYVWLSIAFLKMQFLGLVLISFSFSSSRFFSLGILSAKVFLIAFKNMQL